MNTKAQTLAAYNAHASRYAAKFGKLLEYQKKYECLRFENLLQGKKVLDIGCGAGDSTLYFLDRGYEAYGIDFSEAMIALAKEKGVPSEVMDMEQLEFPPESFDGIWAVTSLLHIEKKNIVNVLERLAKVLKTGGVMYVCLKKGEGEQMILDRYGEGGERFFAFWQEAEFLGVAQEWFECVETKEIDASSEFGNNVFLEFFFRKK